MAFAGFYYSQQEDIVQCVYCQGAIKGWKPNDDPLKVHRYYFPSCPLAAGRPVTNMGSTDLLYFCPGHSHSLSLFRQRLPLRENCTGMGTYVTALLMLLVGLGKIVVAQDITAATGPVRPVDTWKGLVALRKGEISTPTTFSAYNWNLDLKSCWDAETSLGRAVTTFRTTISSGSLPKEFKDSAMEVLSTLQALFLEGQLRKVARILPAVNGSKQNIACVKPTAAVLGPALCEIYLKRALMLEAGFSATSTINGATGAMSALLDTASSYRQHVSALDRTLTMAEEQRLPEGLALLLDTTCPQLLSQCPIATGQAEPSRMMAAVRVVNKAKLVGDDSQLRIELLVPCQKKDKIYASYTLYSLPHAGSEDGVSIIELAKDEIWVQKGMEPGLNFMVSSAKCGLDQRQSYASGPSVCWQTERLQQQNIEGSNKELKLRGEILHVDADLWMLTSLFSTHHSIPMWSTCPNKSMQPTNA